MEPLASIQQSIIRKIGILGQSECICGGFCEVVLRANKIGISISPRDAYCIVEKKKQQNIFFIVQRCQGSVDGVNRGWDSKYPCLGDFWYASEENIPGAVYCEKVRVNLPLGHMGGKKQEDFWGTRPFHNPGGRQHQMDGLELSSR